MNPKTRPSGWVPETANVLWTCGIGVLCLCGFFGVMSGVAPWQATGVAWGLVLLGLLAAGTGAGLRSIPLDVQTGPAFTAPYITLSPKARRRAWRGTAALLGVAGLLLVGDVVATAIWQEPLSAIYARSQQHHLSRELDQIATEDPTVALPAEPGNAARRTQPRGGDPSRRVQRSARALIAKSSLGSPLGRIAIPSIGAKFVFVAGTGPDELRKGPGHYTGTAMPGEPGTVGIAGHRTTYLAPFRHIDQLTPGQRIVLTMPYGTFVYRVTGHKVVSPGAAWVLSRRHDPRLVLTACHPAFSATHRIVVTARLTSTTPRTRRSSTQ